MDELRTEEIKLEAQSPTLPSFGTSYRIDEQIGEGAWSTVYKGWHLRLNKPVAVKCLNRELVSTPQKLKRFEQEAKLVGELNHGNIVRVYDFGCTTDGQPFTVMEFVEGPALGGGKKFEPAEAARVCLQIAQALDFAHSKGVLHRDIKPENILIDQSNNTAKLLDFGIAKAMNTDQGQELTQTGEVIGTPQYMSPEQCEGKPLSGSTDVYSLGCVLFELMAGRAPFEGRATFEVMRQHLEAEPPTAFPGGSREQRLLDRIVRICMSKDPAHRPSAPDLVRLLSLYCEGKYIAAERATAVVERLSRPAISAMRKWMIVASIAVVMAAGVLAASLIHSNKVVADESPSAYTEALDSVIDDIKFAHLEGELPATDKLTSPSKVHVVASAQGIARKIHVTCQDAPVTLALENSKAPPEPGSADYNEFLQQIKTKYGAMPATIQGAYDADGKSFVIGPQSRSWRAQMYLPQLARLHEKATRGTHDKVLQWLRQRVGTAPNTAFDFLPDVVQENWSPPEDAAVNITSLSPLLEGGKNPYTLDQLKLPYRIPAEDAYGERTQLSYQAPYLIAVSAAPWESGKVMKSFMLEEKDPRKYMWIIDPKAGKVLLVAPINLIGSQ